MRDLEERFARLLASGNARMSRLEIIQGLVVVDATDTIASDLNTGIQRVVRETLSRWIDARPELELAAWSDEHGCLMRASRIVSLNAWCAGPEHAPVGRSRRKPGARGRDRRPPCTP